MKRFASTCSRMTRKLPKVTMCDVDRIQMDCSDIDLIFVSSAVYTCIGDVYLRTFCFCFFCFCFLFFNLKLNQQESAVSVVLPIPMALFKHAPLAIAYTSFPLNIIENVNFAVYTFRTGTLFSPRFSPRHQMLSMASKGET